MLKSGINIKFVQQIRGYASITTPQIYVEVVTLRDFFGDYMKSNKKAVSITIRNGFIFGEPCRNRTDNLMIKSHLLCQLS